MAATPADINLPAALKASDTAVAAQFITVETGLSLSGLTNPATFSAAASKALPIVPAGSDTNSFTPSIRFPKKPLSSFVFFSSKPVTVDVALYSSTKFLGLLISSAVYVCSPAVLGIVTVHCFLSLS